LAESADVFGGMLSLDSPDALPYQVIANSPTPRPVTSGNSFVFASPVLILSASVHFVPPSVDVDS
jgi:hypothetical protein